MEETSSVERGFEILVVLGSRDALSRGGLGFLDVAHEQAQAQAAP